MTRFIYDSDIPVVVKTEIQKVLEPWDWVVPVWCERVFIGWNDESDDDDLSAATNVEYPYRWARITFHPSFLKQDAPSKDALHEILHIPTSVAMNWARETIKTLVSEEDAPKFRKSLLDELRERTESATEDLASRIYAHHIKGQ